MSRVGKTVLKGHGLLFEGKAYQENGSPFSWSEKVGCGKCSCGALSPVLPSKRKRQQWHRQHKDEVRAAQASEE